MSKQKLSKWHDGEVKPVHVGVYQRMWVSRFTASEVVYTKWTGDHWTVSYGVLDEQSLNLAYSLEELSIGIEQNLQWRGLVK